MVDDEGIDTSDIPEAGEAWFRKARWRMVALNLSINSIPLPQRMRRLPISKTGFPIPWFVARLEDGSRDFRVADPMKRIIAVKRSLCWLCGEPLGVNKAFVIGPMCVVNRVTSEPPCHLECAGYAAQACPFLAHPRMKRNDRHMPDGWVEAPGFTIARNPGAVAIYVTKTFSTFKPHAGGGGWLIRLPEPERIIWFAEGKTATREQVEHSIETGYPALLKLAEQEGADAIAELAKSRAVAEQYLPTM